MTCLFSVFSNSCLLHFILWAEDVVLANKMYFAEYVITLFRLQAFFSYMYWILIYSTWWIFYLLNEFQNVIKSLSQHFVSSLSILIPTQVRSDTNSPASLPGFLHIPVRNQHTVPAVRVLLPPVGLCEGKEAQKTPGLYGEVLYQRDVLFGSISLTPGFRLSFGSTLLVPLLYYRYNFWAIVWRNVI